MRLITLFVSMFALSLFFSLALAQESDPLTPLTSPTAISYTLPYPGLLPDHPLFFLKKIRDTILELLIRSPVKKAEFMLLQADKKLNMSLSLMDKKNTHLATKILAESITHLEEGENALISVMSASDPTIGPLKDRYVLSIQKHLEVINAHVEFVDGDVQSSWRELGIRTQTLLDNFLSKK